MRNPLPRSAFLTALLALCILSSDVLGQPLAPSSFAGTALTTSSILWTWTDNASDEDGFRILAGAVNVSGDLALDATSWIQTDLSVNASSGPLLVQAFNSGGRPIPPRRRATAWRKRPRTCRPQTFLRQAPR